MLLHPVLDRVRASDPSPAVLVGSRITAIQMGAVLARVIRQSAGPVRNARSDGSITALDADRPPTSFRLPRTWALSSRTFNSGCAFTKRPTAQFTAVPWQRYFTAETKTWSRQSVPAGELLSKSERFARAVLQVLHGKEGAQALLLSVLSPQRSLRSRISALMTLLGHADVVMDEVGQRLCRRSPAFVLDSTTVANNRERWIRSCERSSGWTRR